MAKTVYIRFAYTGGGGAAVDGIDGAALLDGDVCFVFIDGIKQAYVLDDDLGGAESSPDIITPDASAGDKRWVRMSSSDISDDAYASGWNSVTTKAPSKKAVYNKIESMMQTAATEAEDLAGASVIKIITPSTNPQLIKNLKPVVNASVNTLDIFTKSGGAGPDASNIISVAIPDANGYTIRKRAAAYLSGTSQIVMDDGVNYWSKGSHATEVKTAWLYAIWDGTGIVWALAGYSGFNVVPTTTTATDDDYFLLEGSSTYTRSASHYCVAVCKVRYQYNTADTPDHTLKATGENAPQVVWDPKSDYAKTVVLGSDYISASDIADYSAVSAVIKQSGKYIVHGYLYVYIYGTANNAALKIKIGSATYGSAVEYKYITNAFETGYSKYSIPASISAYINAGDTLHLGCAAGSTGAGNRIILSPTGLVFNRND